MFIKYRVEFRPDNLGDFNDYFTFCTEQHRVQVPLIGKRNHPKLSLPTVLECHECLVDGFVVRKFECVNHGGEGKFRFCLENEGLFLNLINISTSWNWCFL